MPGTDTINLGEKFQNKEVYDVLECSLHNIQERTDCSIAKEE